MKRLIAVVMILAFPFACLASDYPDLLGEWQVTQTSFVTGKTVIGTIVFSNQGEALLGYSGKSTSEFLGTAQIGSGPQRTFCGLTTASGRVMLQISTNRMFNIKLGLQDGKLSGAYGTRKPQDQSKWVDFGYVNLTR